LQKQLFQEVSKVENKKLPKIRQMIVDGDNLLASLVGVTLAKLIVRGEKEVQWTNAVRNQVTFALVNFVKLIEKATAGSLEAGMHRLLFS
jgi:hypothetical protein